MQADAQDIASLVELQQLDLELNQLNKQLEDLPQRQMILNARMKRKDIEPKVETIAKLKKETTKKLTRIDDEDASLEKKEHGVQAAIEAASGDFRGVEARTKELNGIFKRRGTIAEEREEVVAELAKVKELEAQVNAALASLDRSEMEATESFKAKGGALKRQIAEKNAKHDEVLRTLSPDIAKAYSTAAAHVSSVVVGRLDGNKCGICRTAIESGRLIDLKAQAPLGVCPHCERLLVIE